MLVAIPVWQGRVSPVFDVAGQVVLVEFDGAEERSRREEALGAEGPERRAGRLAEFGVNTLICGAVSRPLESLLAARQIRVISQICGRVDEIVEAFRAGALQDPRYAMPGCAVPRRCRRRARCGRGRWPAEEKGNP